MPIYQYECRKCQHNLEEFQNADSLPLEKCPSCQNNSLFRVITGGLGFFMSNRTVGIVAERNNDKFSKDFKNHLKNKNKVSKIDKLSTKLPEGAKIQSSEPAPPPSYKKGQKVSNKQLQKASPEQIKNYIEKGRL